MKKFFLSLITIFGFSAYVIYQRMGSPDVYISPTNVPASASSNTQNFNLTASNPTPVKTSSMMSGSSGMMNRGLYKDGVYVGNSADAYYGNIQVKAIIQNGKLTDVQFLDYPQDRGNSVRINTAAMPILKSEAIQAQNANVDMVSGATESSGAFQESLASALSQAQN